MVANVEDVKELAREALPYFSEGWGEPGDSVATEPEEGRKDYPPWVLRVEETARSEAGADWPDKHFYGLVAETLMDLIEYGEHEWEEDHLTVDELIDEVSTSFSVSTLNEELYEWAQTSSDWSDTVHELRDDLADDGEQELELVQEAMGNEVYLLRRAVLETIHQEAEERQME